MEEEKLQTSFQQRNGDPIVGERIRMKGIGIFSKLLLLIACVVFTLSLSSSVQEEKRRVCYDDVKESQSRGNQQLAFCSGKRHFINGSPWSYFARQRYPSGVSSPTYPAVRQICIARNNCLELGTRFRKEERVSAVNSCSPLPRCQFEMREEVSSPSPSPSLLLPLLQDSPQGSPGVQSIRMETPLPKIVRLVDHLSHLILVKQIEFHLFEI
jgi:hypothetical protein